MTLCVAWVRVGQADEGEELVFATDSRLRGGEAWDNGIKLFDLGRTDCLICFAGSTQRAYPLILHASNAIRSHVEWSNPRFDLCDVLELLCKMFTKLCDTIAEPPVGMTVEEIKGDAQFLFGGWSWREQKLCLWRVFYEPELKSFAHEAYHNKGASRIFAFLGDETDKATQLLAQEFSKDIERQLRGNLDMEPMRVLVRMSRDANDIYLIGGALQIAKVYRSGHNEFFGMMWPSTVNGRATVLGQSVNQSEAPPSRYYDPDTALFVETLPNRISSVDFAVFGEDRDFVTRCYPGDALDFTLREADRNRLTRIFRTYAYSDFVTRCEDPSVIETAERAGESEARTAADSSEEGKVRDKEGGNLGDTDSN